MGLYLGTSKFNIVNHTPGIVKNVTENLERAEAALNTYAPTIITITTSVDGITGKYYIESGSTLNIEDPSKEGYNFTGWYINNSNINLDTYVFNENTTIYAKFKEATKYACNLSDFTISGSTISAYTGTDEYVQVPSSYSFGTSIVDVDPPQIRESYLYRIQSYYESITLRTAEGEEFTFDYPYYLDEIMYEHPSSAYYLCSVTMKSGSTNLYSLFANWPVYCNGTKYANSITLRTYLQNNTSGTFNFGGTFEVVGPVEGNAYTITTIAANTFSNKSMVKEIKVSEGITTLTGTTFTNMTGLKAVHLPSTLTTLTPNTVFNNCYYLDTLTVASGGVYDSRDNCNAIIETATNKLIKGCNSTIIPEGITTIGAYAFYKQYTMESINIPEGVTSIETYAFYNNTGLKHIYLPTTFTTMGDYAFAGNSALLSVNLENCTRLTTIAERAFAGDTSLRSIVIPASITTINANSFYNNTGMVVVYNLSSINAYTGETTTSAGKVAAYANKVHKTLDVDDEWLETDGILYYRYDTTYIAVGAADTTTTNLVFRPETSIVRIGAFKSNKIIESVDLSACHNLERLDSTFTYCDKLASVQLPVGLVRILNSTFYGCTALKSLVIPYTCYEVHMTSAFSLSNIEHIYIMSATAISYGGSWSTSATVKIHILESAYERYWYSSNYYWDNWGSTLVADIPDPVYTLEDLVTITYDSTLKGYTVTGNSNRLNYANLELPDTYNDGTNGEHDIVQINQNAFSQAEALTGIKFPTRLKTIGRNSFAGCSIKELTIPSTVTAINDWAFSGCDFIEKVVIPDGVTTLGERAFADCWNLLSVTIPATFKKFSNHSGSSGAFYNCRCLYEIYNLSSNISITLGSSAGCGIGTNAKVVHASLDEPSNISLRDGVYYYSDNTTYEAIRPENPYAESLNIVEETLSFNPRFFYDWQGKYMWIYAILPPTVVNTFSSSSNLSKVYIRTGTLDLYKSAVKWSGISSKFVEFGEQAEIPYIEPLIYTYNSENNSYTVIGYNAASLQKELVVPSTYDDGEHGNLPVLRIENDAFRETAIISLTISEGIKDIGYCMCSSCTKLANVHLPTTLETIDYSAFNSCEALTTINLEDCTKLTVIPNSLFGFCDKIASVTIPSSVTSIGRGSFYLCPQLTTITIPAGVTWIGRTAFTQNSRMRTMIFLGSTPPELEDTLVDIYNGSSYCDSIYVPTGSLSAYQTATSWSRYTSILKEST